MESELMKRNDNNEAKKKLMATVKHARRGT
jgi:hypothetical protein